MKFLFPDCLWSSAKISGATFLYFPARSIAITLHPSVSQSLTGVDPFTFLSYLEQRRPVWEGSFRQFFEMWFAFQRSLHATHTLLEPLRQTYLSVWFSYNRGRHGWVAAGEVLEASQLPKDRIAGLIDPFHAADELFAHIFFEKVLEVQRPKKSPEDFVMLGQRFAAGSIPEPRTDFDWSSIYDYCETLFTQNTLPELLTRAYMFRMALLRRGEPFDLLLSNNNLVPFLASLPITESPNAPRDVGEISPDVIAWEFFRHLVSPMLDPLDASKVGLIGEMLAERGSEIDRLKNRCRELANDIGPQATLEALSGRVRDHVKAKVLNELNDLLKLDSTMFAKYVDDLFGDEKTWIAVATFLAGLLTGGEVVSAGSAIYALSQVGARAVKQAAARREKLASSSYALIYRMHQ
jgi:hypothetical protein